MKFKTILTTLCITLLAGCATDNGDESQVVAKTEPAVRLEDRLRELDESSAGNETPVNQPHVIATPTPVEDGSLAARTDPIAPVRHSQPVTMQEQALIAVTGASAADSYKRMQYPQTAGQTFDIHHARRL